jgi:hypothetical protein
MKRTFRDWLKRRYRPKVVESRISNCKRVEKYYGDLDIKYDTRQMQTLASILTYSSDDERAGRKNPSKILINGNIKEGLATLRNAIMLYEEFRDSEDSAATSEEVEAFPTVGDGAIMQDGIIRELQGSLSERFEAVVAVRGDQPRILNGDDVLLEVTADLGIDLVRLVARSAVWVDPAVFHAMQKRSPHATWFPNCRRGKNGEPKRGTAGSVRLDDNTMANLAIKVAVFGSRNRCTRMHVCHVWPETCYDVRYHTSLANLVLLPAALAGLSDHHEGVAQCLRYRSYELFGWHPADIAVPEMPVGYPAVSDWAQPFPIPRSVRAKFAI